MFRRAAVVVVFMTLGLVAGLALTGRPRTAGKAVAAGTAAEATPQRAVFAAGGGMPDLTAVAHRAIGSVTNISSTQVVRTPNSPFANDPFFRFFFNDQEDAFGYRERRAQSLGSGVIVSPDGYVMTNTHVVANGVEVSVTLPDKRELRAKVVGVDEATDIAVLKIDAGNLPTLPWGDSSKLRVAEWVLAIGNPFQLNETVTLGIVSALGRTSLGISGYEDFIQTDAAINPGNSGGALVNTRGELIGINTAIFSESGGYQGIGFAIPSNLARRVVNDFLKYGEVRRGDIGYVEIAPLTTQEAAELGAPDARGVLVQRMAPRSSAYAAGLRPGDIIVSFNGTVVNDAGILSRSIQDAAIGSTAAVEILRDGRRIPLTIAIQRATEQ